MHYLMAILFLIMYYFFDDMNYAFIVYHTSYNVESINKNIFIGLKI